MKPLDLESRMRQGEYFHSLKVPMDNWTILRLDGRGFSKLTSDEFQKPFDPRFHKLMLETSEALLREFNADYAYTESDEISILLPKNWSFFDREIEKVISISASLAGATFSVAFGKPVQFDSRIWISGSLERVVDYFCWRQSDATRCALNGWAYWKLREEGLSAREVTQELKGLKGSQKQELLFQKGINFNDLPGWQKRGSGIRFSHFNKEGFNPITEETVIVQRRVVEVLNDLTFGDDYRNFLQDQILTQDEAL